MADRETSNSSLPVRVPVRGVKVEMNHS